VPAATTTVDRAAGAVADRSRRRCRGARGRRHRPRGRRAAQGAEVTAAAATEKRELTPASTTSPGLDRPNRAVLQPCANSGSPFPHGASLREDGAPSRRAAERGAPPAGCHGRPSVQRRRSPRSSSLDLDIRRRRRASAWLRRRRPPRLARAPRRGLRPRQAEEGEGLGGEAGPRQGRAPGKS
jgi:hypothetical protein